MLAIVIIITIIKYFQVSFPGGIEKRGHDTWFLLAGQLREDQELRYVALTTNETTWASTGKRLWQGLEVLEQDSRWPNLFQTRPFYLLLLL